MFTHDIIKINYINEGYLPNYPYHLTTDREMFEAFLAEDGYLADNYPCPDESLQDQYDALVAAIREKIDDYLTNGTELEPWIYSYMLGATVGINSDIRDIGDLYTLTGLPITTGEAQFTPELAAKCYEISDEWLRKQVKNTQRPATVFGEPHVFKSLRLSEVNVLAP